jgi:hypothetical protein
MFLCPSPGSLSACLVCLCLCLCLPVHLSTHLPTCLLFIQLDDGARAQHTHVCCCGALGVRVCLPVCLCLCLSRLVYPSTHPPTCSSICSTVDETERAQHTACSPRWALVVCKFVCLSVCVCACVCLFTYLHIYLLQVQVHHLSNRSAAQ